MPISTQDLVKGLDWTGQPNFSPSLLNQSIDDGTIGPDKGLIIESTDSALNTPVVPDAVTTTKFKRYLWKRNKHASATDKDPILYYWNPDTASITTFLQWQVINAVPRERGGATIGAGTYTLTISTVKALFDGMIIYARIGSANTGAATLNINSLGAKSLRKNINQLLIANDLTSNLDLILVYDVGNDWFQILSAIPASATNVPSLPYYYGLDTGAINAAVVIITPAPTALIDGMRVFFKIIATNTGPLTLNVNGLGVKNVYKHKGTVLTASDIIIGQQVEVIYDVSNDAWQLIGVTAITAIAASPGPYFYATTTGAANAYILALNPAIGFGDGTIVNLKASFSNTGAATLNLNGIGAVAIKKNFNQVLVADDIVLDHRYNLIYDAANTCWIILNTVIPGDSIGIAKRLKGSNSGNAIVTITADSIALGDGTRTRYLAQAVNVSADITVSGAGGLDAGAEAPSTWYYIYVIAKSTDNTLSALLSISSSAPTIPTGYTDYALVGVVRNNGASNFISFIQRGKDIWTGNYTIFSGKTATVALTFEPLAGADLTAFQSNVPTAVATKFRGFAGSNDAAQNGVISLSSDGNVILQIINIPAVALYNTAFGASGSFELPLTGTNFYWTSVVGNSANTLCISGYTIS